MARELVHVRHDDGAPLRRRGAAHAFAERDAHARGLALERADDQLAVLQKIEADPVHVRQRIEDQRRGVGRIGDQVALAGEQRFQLLRETLVVAGLVPEVIAGSWRGSCALHGKGEHFVDVARAGREHHQAIEA